MEHILISKKYLNDYHLEIEELENGKVRDYYRYTGDYYELDLSKQDQRALRIRLLLFAFLMTFLFIAPLMVYSTLTRVIYISIPFILLLIPLYLLYKTVYYLFRVKGQFKREEKEKALDRIKGIPIIFFVLLIMIMIGQAIGYMNHSSEIGYGDYVLFGSTILLAVSDLYLFQKTKKISIKTFYAPKH